MSDTTLSKKADGLALLTPDNIEHIQLLILKFTGKLDEPTWEKWYKKMDEVITSILPAAGPVTKAHLLKLLVDDDIHRFLDCLTTDSWSGLTTHMGEHYPNNRWMEHYHQSIIKGTLFKGHDVEDASAQAGEAFNHLGMTSYLGVIILESLVKHFTKDLMYTPEEVWMLKSLPATEFYEHLTVITNQPNPVPVDKSPLAQPSPTTSVKPSTTNTQSQPMVPGKSKNAKQCEKLKAQVAELE
ncbi:hypothetical protein IWQ61_010784, partial [Dispira simplex]